MASERFVIIAPIKTWLLQNIIRSAIVLFGSNYSRYQLVLPRFEHIYEFAQMKYLCNRFYNIFLALLAYQLITPCASTDGNAFHSVTTLAPDLALSSSRSLGDFLLPAVAAATLPTFAAKPQKFPQTPGTSLISWLLRGTFPLGLPECIRQTAWPCVRGPDRAARCAARAVAIRFCSSPIAR